MYFKTVYLFLILCYNIYRINDGDNDNYETLFFNKNFR